MGGGPQVRGKATSLISNPMIDSDAGVPIVKNLRAVLSVHESTELAIKASVRHVERRTSATDLDELASMTGQRIDTYLFEPKVISAVSLVSLLAGSTATFVLLRFSWHASTVNKDPILLMHL